MLSTKAAKLLGVDSADDAGLRSVELLEEVVHPSFSGNIDVCEDDEDQYAVRLVKHKHINYLCNALSEPLSRGFISLDASHPWMVYWCLHSLDLMHYFDPSDTSSSSAAIHDVETLQKSQLLKRIVSTLKHCWTNASLQFDVDEVRNNEKLTELYLMQQKEKEGIISNTKEANGKIKIIGGGFGGGPQQMPHCAPTYAAVLALCIIASIGSGTQHQEEFRSHLNPYHDCWKSAMELLHEKRLPLYAFFLSLREQDDLCVVDGKDEKEGGRIAFRMQHDGEIDVRASYCILAPCHLLGLLDKVQEKDYLLSPSIARYIASCQTFEGGFGAEPFNEAHGGYTFCALAALRILDSVSMVDVEQLRSWLARRQMEFEGGFCGRTNKLVDGCYSFWQGGAIAVIDGWCNEMNDVDDKIGGDYKDISFDEIMLQRYILLCAQDVNGGLRDKPSKPKDFYHSCYNLSGLSVAQHALENDDKEFNRLFGDRVFNILGRTDPVLNIRVERVRYIESEF